MSYLTVVVLQLLLPFYFGNELIVASEKLSTSLFHCQWHEQSEKFKTSMKIFMEDGKNPVKISAYKVFDLSLETFMKIINFAYSLYAVLKRVNS